MLPVRVDQELDAQAKLRAHREAVHAIEDEMKKCEPWPFELRHYFAHGVYAREVTLREGCVATGKIHKYAQVNIISKGAIRVSTEHGVVELRAPCTFVSPPGTKRLVTVLEETIWTTIIGTDETDIEKLEADLVVNSEEEYARHLELTHGKLVEIA